MSAQPFNAPSCWSRQFEENDSECNACDHRNSCRQAYFRSVGMPMAAPPPPPAWNTGRVHLPVMPTHQQQAPVQSPQQPTPTTAVSQMFWQTPQAPYFEPMEGEGMGERLAKNATLAMGASLFETLGSFFRTWRWPKPPGK